MDLMLKMLMLEAEEIRSKMRGGAGCDLTDGEMYAQLQLLARLERGLMKEIGYV